MYALYAEATSDRLTVKVKDLRSKRFSRAMREARAEPGMKGCRLFVAQPGPIGPDMETASYLDTPAKPAPVGSPANQALQRTTLRRQKPSARSGARPVQWED